ncbi:MAG: ABC transporter permease subunit [Eubacteriaceae bacterium]|nr:ABC transporter permease subunit [Eubacteriaceae bacterium]
MKDSTIQNDGRVRMLKHVLALVFWLVLWHLAAVKVGSPIILPTPGAAFQKLLEMIPEKEFQLSVGTTMLRIAIGITLSSTVGIIAGVLCGLYRPIYEIISPVIAIIKAVPVISVSILILLWLSDSAAPVAVCFLLCFPAMWSNTLRGILETDKKLLEMAYLYKVGKCKIIRTIYMANLKPYVLSGLSISIGLGWKSTVTAELLSSSRYSIGRMIYNSKIYLVTEELFAWTLVVVVLSFLMEYMIGRIMKAAEGMRKNEYKA